MPSTYNPADHRLVATVHETHAALAAARNDRLDAIAQEAAPPAARNDRLVVIAQRTVDAAVREAKLRAELKAARKEATRLRSNVRRRALRALNRKPPKPPKPPKPIETPEAKAARLEAKRQREREYHREWRNRPENRERRNAQARIFAKSPAGKAAQKRWDLANRPPKPPLTPEEKAARKEAARLRDRARRKAKYAADPEVRARQKEASDRWLAKPGNKERHDEYHHEYDKARRSDQRAHDGR